MSGSESKAHGKGLQVIGAGLPRTSTSSLQTGLQILGYDPCYHTITHLLPNASTQGPMWLKAMNTRDKAVRQKILAEIVSGYSAIVDGPGCFFVEDWVEMYPDAKVEDIASDFILGMRKSPQAWLDSVMGSMGKVFGKGPMYYLMNNLWDVQTFEKHGVHVRTTDFYLKHNDEIREIVPKERLLEFQAADGWAPLCNFLGKEKPAGEFPHRNDSRALRRKMAVSAHERGKRGGSLVEY
ncbi:hypothetical protein BU16DRAFT_575558 [Lophium mytilinum]|uniref:NAD dependent epimerase/dehydratase n=1 Tax=Lophium mytilinum TaxID=390894 RepID=A0A6A6QDJ7_9PEZI|nr:hypothetical protein BU16DRAFT_575558 [Lophium mytilinum]